VKVALALEIVFQAQRILLQAREVDVDRIGAELNHPELLNWTPVAGGAKEIITWAISWLRSAVRNIAP